MYQTECVKNKHDPANQLKKVGTVGQESKVNCTKEIFADAVSASNTSILIGELAKLLKQNGIETGQRRLFTWMRDNGYLIKSGSSKNMPTQKSMELGLLEIKEGSYINGAGVWQIFVHT